MTAFGPRLSRKKANLLPLNPIAMRPLRKIGFRLILNDSLYHRLNDCRAAHNKARASITLIPLTAPDRAFGWHRVRMIGHRLASALTKIALHKGAAQTLRLSRSLTHGSLSARAGTTSTLVIFGQ
jgi:hypothetical protein